MLAHPDPVFVKRLRVLPALPRLVASCAVQDNSGHSGRLLRGETREMQVLLTNAGSFPVGEVDFVFAETHTLGSTLGQAAYYTKEERRVFWNEGSEDESDPASDRGDSRETDDARPAAAAALDLCVSDRSGGVLGGGAAGGARDASSARPGEGSVGGGGRASERKHALPKGSRRRRAGETETAQRSVNGLLTWQRLDARRLPLLPGQTLAIRVTVRGHPGLRGWVCTCAYAASPRAHQFRRLTATAEFTASLGLALKGLEVWAGALGLDDQPPSPSPPTPHSTHVSGAAGSGSGSDGSDGSARPPEQRVAARTAQNQHQLEDRKKRDRNQLPDIGVSIPEGGSGADPVPDPDPDAAAAGACRRKPEGGEGEAEGAVRGSAGSPRSEALEASCARGDAKLEACARGDAGLLLLEVRVRVCVCVCVCACVFVFACVRGWVRVCV